MGIGTVSRGAGRGRRRSGRRSRLNADINVTPLVDVMLVLLIVFMVAAPLLSVGVPVELPKTDAKSLPSESEPITITVDNASDYGSVMKVMARINAAGYSNLGLVTDPVSQ